MLKRVLLGKNTRIAVPQSRYNPVALHQKSLMAARIPPTIINFGRGQPGPSMIPKEMMLTSTIDQLNKRGNEEYVLQYGEEQGSGNFRIELAKLMNGGLRETEPKYECNPDHLFITNGSSNALDLIIRFLTKPGDTILVEDPTYFIAKKIFEDNKVELIGVPVDSSGLDVDALERILQTCKVPPKLLYCIPTYHNPCGINLIANRRKKLVALAKKYDFYIMADEVYQLLYFDDREPPPPPLIAYEGENREKVLSCGSFSKILAPGVRLGWIEAAPKLIEKFSNLGYVLSGGGLNPYVSSIVESSMELGLLQNHIQETRRVLGKRCKSMCEFLRENCPGLSFIEPKGGYFVWVSLPDGLVADKQFLDKFYQAQINFHPGFKFSVCPGSQQNELRLSFAYYEEETMIKGLQVFASVFRSIHTQL